MRVPFFELRRLYLEQKEELDAAVVSVLDSGWYILGKTGERFEKALGESLVGPGGAAVGCNSGTDALILPLLALGAGPGDEVVTPSLTAIPTITAIRSTGATPVFAEIDRETWVLDATQIERALTPRTKAIVAVHLYGNMVDVTAIRELLSRKKREDVAIIEDVAQAHGAMLGGQPAGALTRFGAFSFYPSKNIGALGDGGAVFAKDADDQAKLRMLRNYGQRDRYNAELARGLNSRLDEVQAAVLGVRLGKLEEWNRRKAAMMQRYHEAFAGLPLRFQKATPGCLPAWHLCVVALESHGARDAFMTHLKAAGVETIIHYPIPTHEQAAFKSHGASPLVVTEDLARRIVSIPMNACLSVDEQSHVIDSAKSFFRR